MNEATLLELTRRSLAVAVELATPFLAVTLIVGVSVSIFQAATQIQEQTLTFVPKIIAVVLAIVILGPWMLSLVVHFTSSLFTSAPNYLH